MPSRYTAFLFASVLISDTLRPAFQWHVQPVAYVASGVEFSKVSSWRVVGPLCFLLRLYPNHSTKWLQVPGWLLYTGCNRAAGLPRRLVSPQHIYLLYLAWGWSYIYIYASLSSALALYGTCNNSAAFRCASSGRLLYLAVVWMFACPAILETVAMSAPASSK